MAPGKGGKEDKVFRIAKKAARKIGRDAGTGQFVTVKNAKQHPKTTVVETIRAPKKPKRK